MVELFVNSGDPDQTPLSAASYLGLHCLPITLLGVSRLQWVNMCSISHCYGGTVIIIFVLLILYLTQNSAHTHKHTRTRAGAFTQNT